ncbi:MAG: hypothetical protein RL226_1171 [Bacteroidota bacterium]|jgi:ATP-binding cassette subfamily B protein
MRALLTLNKYFWKYRWRFILGIFFIVLTNIFGVYSPVLIGEGVNMLSEANTTFLANDAAIAFEPGESIQLPPSISYLSDLLGIDVSASQNIQSREQASRAIVALAIALAVLYIVVYLIKGVFLFFTRQTIIVMSRLIEYDQKNEIFDHYQRLSMAFYKRNNTGDLMNRISEDVSKVRMYLGPAVMYTLNLVVMIVLVVIFMLRIDVELTLYVLLPLPFMSVSIYYVSNLMNRRSEEVQRQQSRLSTIVQEAISGIRVLKAYSRENYSTENFKFESDLYKTKAIDQVRVDALFMPIIVLLVGLSTILTIYIGGQKVISGEMNIGQVFEFIFFVNLLTWPFASVGWVTSLVQKAEASQQRINEFLKQEPEIINRAETRRDISGEIEFRGVSFDYPDSGIRAIDQLSFKVDAGKTLAIIGRTGSGKSTIANLIARQYDPTTGDIFVDGIPLKEHNLYHLRTALGYVPQEVFLFSDSIRNNIAFGIDDPQESKVVQAAKHACVHDNILEFPKGYDTLLGERGINLSGGQKQRISIARAIIKEPKILLFDDCLSAVDTETEEAILSHLKQIMHNRTSIIISHRVSTIKHADHIVLLDHGRIKEEGTHQSLLEMEGAYYELYQKQLLEERTDELN